MRWRLATDEMYLREKSPRLMKSIATIPEAHTKLAHVTIDTAMVACLAKLHYPQLYPDMSPDDLIALFVTYPDWAWRHFFQVDEVKEMVTHTSNFEFDHVAQTDGVAISFIYTKVDTVRCTQCGVGWDTSNAVRQNHHALLPRTLSLTPPPHLSQTRSLQGQKASHISLLGLVCVTRRKLGSSHRLTTSSLLTPALRTSSRLSASHTLTPSNPLS